MVKKFVLFQFIFFLVIQPCPAQPKVWLNEVTLYLSTGDTDTGLLIEIRDNSLQDRILIIWNEQKGYVSYPLQDVEALTHNYGRDLVEMDISRLKWKKQVDYLVLVKAGTDKKVDILEGFLSSYNNSKGEYKLGNAIYRNREVGAVYFYNSDHSHFTNVPNPFAQPPTLKRNVIQDKPLSDYLGRRTDTTRLILKRPAGRPDVVVNMPAVSPIFRITDVESGERFYIEVSGAVKINQSVEIGPAGYGGNISDRIRPDVATGVVMAFVGPSADPVIRIPAAGELFPLGPSSIYTTPKFGALYLTLNDLHPQDNSGSFRIEIWKLR